MDIKPGTLCLVISGPDMGKGVMAIRATPVQEVVSYLANTYRMICEVRDKAQKCWEVDMQARWKAVGGPKKGETFLAPFLPENQLMPIPPLADPLDIKQQEELKI